MPAFTDLILTVSEAVEQDGGVMVVLETPSEAPAESPEAGPVETPAGGAVAPAVEGAPAAPAPEMEAATEPEVSMTVFVPGASLASPSIPLLLSINLPEIKFSGATANVLLGAS